jgi:hypothetical protein
LKAQNAQNLLEFLAGLEGTKQSYVRRNEFN